MAARLARQFQRFGKEESAQFRALVAFASAAGLRLIAKSLHRFLRRGHRAFWIVGIDLGGTGRQALQFLHDLRKKFPDQVNLRVLTLGDNARIFHPKVYWFDAPTLERVVLIGSPNATRGGFRDNLEVAVEFSLTDVGDELFVKRVETLWMTYSTPLPPFSEEHLLEVDQHLIDKLHDDAPIDNRPRHPHPMASRPLKTPRVRRTSLRRQASTLVQDVLEETRETQVQLPVEAIRPFFGRAQRVRLRYVQDSVIVKEDDRPLIHLSNNTHRIEIDAVRGLPRPQIIRFSRPAPAQGPVNYELLLRGTSEYRVAAQLLATRGRQTRKGSRRWLLQ